MLPDPLFVIPSKHYFLLEVGAHFIDLDEKVFLLIVVLEAQHQRVYLDEVGQVNDVLPPGIRADHDELAYDPVVQLSF